MRPIVVTILMICLSGRIGPRDANSLGGIPRKCSHGRSLADSFHREVKYLEVCLSLISCGVLIVRDFALRCLVATDVRLSLSRRRASILGTQGRSRDGVMYSAELLFLRL